MTSITRFLRRVSVSASSMILAAQLLVPTASALEDAEVKEAMNQIHNATISSYYSVNGFYNFSANQGDQDQLTEINDSVSNINQLVNGLEGSLNTGATSEALKSALEGWKTYQKVLNQNIDEVLETGYQDLRMAGQMASTNISFNEALSGLYTTLVNSSNVKPSEIQTLSRELSTTIALMMTKYSARTTSTVGQAYSSGEESETTIDALAKEFDKKLMKLVELTKDNKEASDALDSAVTKWEFIRQSYMNYNENRVNFVVNLNSKKIISLIQSASAAM